MAQTGKLYLTKAHTTANIAQTVTIELKGTVNLIIYGSEEKESLLVDVTDLTPVTDTIVGDSYYPFFSPMPKYIAFIGTADRINPVGLDLTYIKDIT